LLGAGGLWLYQDVLGPAKPGANVYADSQRPEPERRRSGERALERLQQQVQRPRQDDAPVRRGPADAPTETLPAKDPDQFGVTISEKDANDLLGSLPEVQRALEQANVSDLNIHFEPGHLVAEGRVPVVGGMKARITATGTISARDGDLVYATEDVRIGSFPAPKAVRQELDRQLGASVKRLNERFHGRIDSVQLRDQELEVRGKLQ
jgi:hypothetical protein